jgi:epoxyqueuosine reductase
MNISNASPSAAQVVKTLLEKKGLSEFGFADLEKPLSLDIYRDWLKDGLHGEMQYLERHLPDKENPARLLPRALSAIVIAVHYRPQHPDPQALPLRQLRIASYAAGGDYHEWLKKYLNEIIKELHEHFPNDVFLAATDSSPVLERDLAYRAGLGWFGKNTCLIDQQKGSFFLIGEILTSVALTPIRPLVPDRCGTCSRCIDACPTGAIIAPRKLDAKICISYLTIESKKNPDLSLAEKMGDHFFGCDICQSVCPWNQKALDISPWETESKRILNEQTRLNLQEDLEYILNTSNKELERTFRYTPLARSRGFGLKRNALLVIGNQQLTSLIPTVKKLILDPRLGELAHWALDRLKV